MNTTKHSRGRNMIVALVAGLGFWLGAAVSALAADQWFDSGTAAGIQPASGTSTGGLVWANAAAGSAMWADTSAGTNAPLLWTSDNNAYFTAAGTATVGVNGATASSVIFDSAGTWVFTNAGAAFTFADLTLKRGTVTVYSNALGSSSSTPVTLGAADQLAFGTLKLDTVAAGDNTFTIGNLTAAGFARLILTNSVAGSTPILSGATLGRTGRGLLVAMPTNIATLGVTSKVLFTGGTNLTAGGILAPWLVAQGPGGVYDLVSNGANGLTTNGVYQTGAWDSTKVISALTATTLTANASVYALKLGGSGLNYGVSNGVTLTLGDWTCAGLILNNNNLLGGGTVAVNTAELIVHAYGTATVAPVLSGSGGLTLNALAAAGNGVNVTLSNMTYSGDTWINAGTLIVAPGAGITQTYTNSIRGPGGFTKTGAGTLILANGNSSIVGGLSVSGGTLVFSGGTWTNAAIEDNTGTMIISNGAQVVGLASWNIGQQGGSANGGGVLTITNATLTTQSGGTFYVGNGNKSNTVNILAGGVLNANNAAGFTVGRGDLGQFDVVNINGGTVTNGGAVGIGTALGSLSNRLDISNGGKLSATSVSLSGSNNSFNVGGAGLASTATVGSVTIGNAAGYFGNAVTVTNATLWSGAVIVGGTGSTNNTATITTGGLWTNSSFTVSSGTSTGSQAFVTSGGILETVSLIVGAGADNLITNAGGVYQFTSATPTITTNGVAGGSVFLNNGTIAFRNVSRVNVKGNWAGTGLTNMTFLGTGNAFRLDNSSGTNTYWFDAIAGAVTNYAGLEMVNGNTAYTNGSVTIGTNGWLTCSNTTAILWGTVTNYGRMTFNNSTVTFTNGLVLNPSPNLQMIWTSNSTVNVNGTLNLPVSMVFSNAQPIAPGTTVALNLTASGGFGTSSPSGWTVYPNSHRIMKSGNSLVLTPRQPGFLFIVE